MQPAASSTLVSARVAGAMYLAIIALGLFGESYVRGSLVVGGDAAATASNVLGASSLWRAGIGADLVMHVLDVPLIVFFYLLLRPIDRRLALLATGFNVVQTCVLVANKLNFVGALMVLASRASAAGSIDGPALASLAIGLHGYGFGIGLIFFGAACLVRARLILASGYVPRTLGVLLALAGIAYLVNSFALLLAPSVAEVLFPAALVPAFVGEFALATWLLLTNPRVLQQRVAARAAAAYA